MIRHNERVQYLDWVDDDDEEEEEEEGEGGHKWGEVTEEEARTDRALGYAPGGRRLGGGRDAAKRIGGLASLSRAT